MMKKVLVLVSVICVMCIAGTALAKTNANAKRRRPVQQRIERPMPPKPARPVPPKKSPRRSRFTPDMPKEIREKTAELEKLKIDLEEAMTSRPLNKEKALDVHGKMQKVRQEIEAWRFAKRLERIEARQNREAEMLKKLPPHLQEEAGISEAEAEVEVEVEETVNEILSDDVK
ncbi:MAG: hypothetical protein IJR27_07695 [Synergistaceae bacterium]|nr:hypothetical protein [Synergistaceae bacterium]